MFMYVLKITRTILFNGQAYYSAVISCVFFPTALAGNQRDKGKLFQIFISQRLLAARLRTSKVIIGRDTKRVAWATVTSPSILSKGRDDLHPRSLRPLINCEWRENCLITSPSECKMPLRLAAYLIQLFCKLFHRTANELDREGTSERGSTLWIHSARNFPQVNFSWEAAQILREIHFPVTKVPVWTLWFILRVVNLFGTALLLLDHLGKYGFLKLPHENVKYLYFFFF